VAGPMSSVAEDVPISDHFSSLLHDGTSIVLLTGETDDQYQLQLQDKTF